MTLTMEKTRDGQPAEPPQPATLFGGKLYRGEIVGQDGQPTTAAAAYRWTVTVNGRPLRPRFDLHRHSPDGFSWGFAGSGPAQLALALCADFLEDDERARRIYQRFKFRCIANLTEPSGEALPSWSLTGDQVGKMLEEIARADGRDPKTFERLESQPYDSVPGAPARPMPEGQVCPTHPLGDGPCEPLEGEPDRCVYGEHPMPDDSKPSA